MREQNMVEYKVEGLLAALKALDLALETHHLKHESDGVKIDKVVINAHYRFSCANGFSITVLAFN